jgi:hypothetical protein
MYDTLEFYILQSMYDTLECYIPQRGRDCYLAQNEHILYDERTDYISIA